MSPSSSESMANGTADDAATTPCTADESQKDLEYIQIASEQLKYEDHGGNQMINSPSTVFESPQVTDFNGAMGGSSSKGTSEIEEIREEEDNTTIVTEPNLHIPSEIKDQSAANSDTDGSTTTRTRQNSTNNNASKDFEGLYGELDKEQKMCLLCFTVFPENGIINKRFMIYWWIGNGFVCPPPPGSQETAEDLANEVFKRLMRDGFIEAVYEKRSLEVNRCKMHCIARAVVIVLADRATLLGFDPRARGGFTSLRACLWAGKRLNDNPDLDKVHMLLNVDATALDFDEKPEVLFSKMKNVNVLCLGRWQTDPKHHIEVEYHTTKFLGGLKNMKHLRFLSLQGISRITLLPRSISKLSKLTILDLRACHNLLSIPDGIGSLKSLTHLDMSGCYLLHHMPRTLSKLSNLQVLKGFVVGNSKGRRSSSCTLEDLQKKLKKLRKLGIYASVKAEMIDLGKFKALRKLKIEWIGDSQGRFDTRRSTTDGRSSFNFRVPRQLEKLHLQCCPPRFINWHEVPKMKRLNKLYISGGKLSNLGQSQQERVEWNVKVLRLKFLSELEIDWGKLRELFPRLIYLEKVKCPKLTQFPCDEQGVWMINTEEA